MRLIVFIRFKIWSVMYFIILIYWAERHLFQQAWLPALCNNEDGPWGPNVPLRRRDMYSLVTAHHYLLFSRCTQLIATQIKHGRVILQKLENVL